MNRRMGEGPGASGPARGGGPGGGMQTGKAAVVIVVLVVIGWLVLRHTTSPKLTSTRTSATTPAASTTTTTGGPTTTTTIVPPSSVKVQVLNGTGGGTLAGQWSTKLKSSFGYITEPPDDATAKVSQSAIYVLTPGYLPEAYALATSVGVSSAAVVTTSPPPASAPIPPGERSTANLVLVVGSDLAGSA